MRFDEIAEMYERSAEATEAPFAWPNGITRERAVELIAKVRPALVLDDATDAYVAGAFASLVDLKLIDLSGEEARNRELAHCAAIAAALEKGNAQLAQQMDEINASRATVRADAEPDPLAPQLAADPAWVSPSPGTKSRKASR